MEHVYTPSVQEDPFTEEAPQPKSATDPTEVEVPAVVDLIMEVLVITPDWTCRTSRTFLGRNSQRMKKRLNRSSVDQSLYCDKRTAVQRKCNWSQPEMHNTRRRSSDPQRHPLGDLWPPCVLSDHCGQSISSGILLATSK